MKNKEQKGGKRKIGTEAEATCSTGSQTKERPSKAMKMAKGLEKPFTPSKETMKRVRWSDPLSTTYQPNAKTAPIKTTARKLKKTKENIPETDQKALECESPPRVNLLAVKACASPSTPETNKPIRIRPQTPHSTQALLKARKEKQLQQDVPEQKSKKKQEQDVPKQKSKKKRTSRK